MVGETLGQLARLRSEARSSLVARERHDLPDGIAVQHRLFARTFWERKIETPVADWTTKRAWVDYAFKELESAGYHVSSAYTMVRRILRQGELQLPRQSLAAAATCWPPASPASAMYPKIHYQNLA